MFRHSRDHGRRRIAQMTVVTLLATSLAVATAPTFAQASPAGAPANAAAAAAPLPWTGTMKVEYIRVRLAVGGNARYTQSGKADYTQIQPDPDQVDEDGWGAYFADVDATSGQQVDSTCGVSGGGLRQAQTSGWDYVGDSRTSNSTANGGSGFINGNVLNMREGADGVHLLMHYAQVNAVTNYHCPNSPIPTGLNGYDAFSFHSGTMTNHADLPLADTDPDPNRLAGTTTFAPSHIPGGPTYELYEFTVTYDLRRVADQCSGEVLYPAYQAGAPGQQAFLEFELDVIWCQGADGPRDVQSAARGRTLISPFEHAVESLITEVFTFNDVWRGSTVTRSGNFVTAVGEWEQCSGLPLLAKAKHLDKVAKGLRSLGKLIRKIDKYKSVTKKIDRLIRITARQLEKAADGGIAKWLAKQAFRTFTTTLEALPKSVQKKLTKAIYYVVFDYYLSKPWAKDYLKYFVPDVPISKLMSNELVCKTGWTPVITVELGKTATPTYTDLAGDGLWDVRRVR